MRRKLVPATALAIALGGAVFTPQGKAQQRGGPVAPKAGRSAATDPDPLRPYATRDIRALAAVGRAYSRTSPPPPPTIEETRSRAAVFARGARDYYPALKTGQGPNRNYIDPRTLCVPGRRALIPR
jgi:hypothetical protein